MKKKNVTIQNVADRAGVSKSTVSHVMHNTAKLRDETREKVLKVIKDLDYRPNAIARSLRTQKSDIIGLIIPDISNEFYANVVKGVSDFATQEGYSVIINNTEYKKEHEIYDVHKLIENIIDGIIFVGGTHSEELINEIKKRNIPIVTVDRYIEGNDISSVETDNTKATLRCVDYLYELGHTRMGFITESLEFSNLKERYMGYKLGLMNNGLLLDKEIVFVNEKLLTNKLINSYEMMKNLLEKNDIQEFPTAFVCASDLIALGIIKAIKEKGYKVPEDISVIGFDNIVMSNFIEPTLTTVEQMKFEMGARAMKLMCDLIKEKVTTPERIILGTKLIIRNSCGPVKDISKK